jgi:hypothetical protein
MANQNEKIFENIARKLQPEDPGKINVCLSESLKNIRQKIARITTPDEIEIFKKKFDVFIEKKAKEALGIFPESNLAEIGIPFGEKIIRKESSNGLNSIGDYIQIIYKAINYQAYIIKRGKVKEFINTFPSEIYQEL